MINKRCFKKLLWLLLFKLCYLSNLAFASTLEEAVEYSLLNNKDLALEKARLQVVKTRKADIYTEFLPEIKAFYQVGKQQNDALNLDREDLDDVQDQDIKSVSLNQPIFNGFQSYNNVKVIDYSVKEAEQYYRTKFDSILYSIIDSYLNLYKYQKIADLKLKSLENSKKILELMTQRKEVGEIDSSELMVFEVRYSTALSENHEAQKDLFNAKEEYRKNVGRLDNNLILPVVPTQHINYDLDSIIQKILKNNPDLKRYFYKIQIAKSELNKAKGVYLPKAEFMAKIEEQENVAYLDNSDVRSGYLYLNVSVPIFQKGKEYTALNTSHKELSFSEIEYKTNRDFLIKEAKTTHNQLLFYNDLIKSYDKIILTSQNRVSKIKEKVEIGDGDIIDFLSAELEFNNALQELIDSKINYLLSYYKLLALLGELSKKSK